MQYRDEGFVLKKVDLAEADQILTILTKEHGKFSSVAKGIRKIKSRKGGNADLFTYSRFNFASGKNLDLLLQAETINPFLSLKLHLHTIAILFYISELVDKFLADEEPHQEILFLVLDTLKALEKSVQYDNLLVRSFELKILAFSGYQPQLHICNICRKDIKEGEDLLFTENGVIHRQCKDRMNHSFRYAIHIDSNDVKVMKFLLTSSINQIVQLKGAEEALGHIKSLTKHMIEDTISATIKSYNFLQST